MDADERDIYLYLKSYRAEYIPALEISKRAGGKHKFRDDPNWTRPPLQRMLDRGILETDNGGHYRLKAKPVQADKRNCRWVSPELSKILRESGKQFNNLIMVDTEEELDAYYDSL